MPNDLAKRNLLNWREDSRKKLASSGFTASIWTLSGVVLVACGTVEDFLGLDDGGGGGRGNTLHVQSSAVQGARLYFDTDGDGDVTRAERDAQDALYPEGFITDATGQASGIPAEFYGKPFEAHLDGAINGETGEALPTTIGNVLHSIPNERGQHLLASPITEYIEGQTEEPKEVVADLINEQNPDSEEVARTLEAILNPRSYLGGDDRIEALSVYLADRNPPMTDEDEASEFLVGDDATQNPETLFIANADTAPATADVIDLPEKTIGVNAAAGTYIATIHAVSHGANPVGYSIVESDGTTPVTGGDFSVDSDGVISVATGATLSAGTDTIYVRVSNGDSAQTVTIDVTIAPVVTLSHASGAGSVAENADGAIAVEGIMVSETVTAADFTISDALGVTADYANMFEIEAATGAPNTWNLKLKDNMELDFETIPNGVINLRLSVQPTDNAPSNILDLAITVTDDPSDIAFSGDMRGEVTKDSGEYVVSGTIAIANQGSNAVSVTESGDYGTLTFNSGTWTYTLDNTDATVQSLLQGQLLIDTAELTVGGVTQSISIIIMGANKDVHFVANNAPTTTASVDVERGDPDIMDRDIFNGLTLMNAQASDLEINFAGTGGNYDLFTITDAGLLTFSGDNDDVASFGGGITLNLEITAPTLTTETISFALQVNVINMVDDGRAEYEITGEVDVGQTLTVSMVQGTEDPDGVVSAVVFQWFRGDESSPTLLGTGNTYRVTQADIDSGDSIGVFVRYTDGSGTTYTNTDGDAATTIAVFASPVKFTTPNEATPNENDENWEFQVTATSEDSDSDGSDSDIASYEIFEVRDASGAAVQNNGIFSISNAGLITISRAFDRETDGAFFTLRVRATDTVESAVPGDEADSGTQTITIRIGDENDNAPAFAESAYSATIDETLAVGQPVGVRVEATDDDGTSANNQVTYSITAGNTGDAFTIDATTGVISVASPLDFETTETYTLTISATDGLDASGTTDASADDTTTVTITINDINDESPTVPNHAPTGSARITAAADNPSSGSGTGMGYTVTVADDDASNVIDVSVSGDPRFDFVDRGNNVWELILLAGREIAQSELNNEITLSYTVTDGGAPLTTPVINSFTLTVIDTPVSFTGPADRTIDLDEDTTAGSTVHFAVRATSEDDAGQSVGIASYMLLDDTGTATTTYRGFTIDSSSGDITLTGSLDHEDTHADGATITLRVQATDMNSPAETNTLTLTVNVGDLNDNIPVFVTKAEDDSLVADGDTVELPENAVAGTVVARVRATDADGTSPHNRVEYSLTTGTANFEIDATSGEITVKSGATFDFEGATKEYTISVRAYDGPSGSTEDNESDLQQITVRITDINDESPTVPNHAATGSARITAAADNTAPAGTIMDYSVTVSDADADATNELDVSVSGDPRFDFVRQENTNTWNLVLLTGQAIAQSELGDTISLSYTVTDGGAPLTTPVTNSFTLEVVDSPIKLSLTPVDILETRDATPFVTLAPTVDNAPTGHTFSFEYVPGTDSDLTSLFEVNIGGTSGAIGVAGSNLDRDTGPASYILPIRITYDSNGATTGGDIETRDVNVVVNIDDANDNEVAFAQTTYSTTVEESAVAGALVLQVEATDADATAIYNTVAYDIVGGTGMGLFDIDNEGRITVASGATFNFESTTKTYTLDITATDGLDVDGDPEATVDATATVTITVTDVNDNEPNLIPPATSDDLQEGTRRADTEVFTGITVLDDDAKTYAQGDFTLTGDPRFRFVWDATAQTGNIILTSGSAITSSDSITLTLTVTDNTDTPVGHSGVDTVTFTLTGIPKPPFGASSGNTGAAMQYDAAAVDASGTITLDADSALLAKPNPVAGDYTITDGQYGTATVDETGAWTYNVNNDHADVKALASGATLTDTFTINVPLAAGGTGGVEVQVTITGQTGTQVSGTSAANTINQASATGFEVIQGGALSDVITVGDFGSLVIGGYGDDEITLGDGVDTVIHRFSSQDSGSWRNDDGALTITDFERGKDKLILVDTDSTAIDLATFIDEDESGGLPANAADDGRVLVQPIITSEGGLTGLTIRMVLSSPLDGPDGAKDEDGFPVESDAGLAITINFDESYDVATHTVNRQHFLGIGDDEAPAGDFGFFDTTERWLTDYKILPFYFDPDGSSEHFDVIGSDELMIDII